MPWNAQLQVAAQQEADGYMQEFNDKWIAWTNAVRSSAPTAANNQAAVEDVVRRWQQSLTALQSQSDSIMSNDNAMDELGQLANSVAEEKVTLRRLRSLAVTRDKQSDSVNPKVRGSPYTNILGLNRVFRDSTRFSIMIASIVFGVLSLGSLGYLVYSISATGALVPEGYVQAGGSKRTNFASSR